MWPLNARLLIYMKSFHKEMNHYIPFIAIFFNWQTDKYFVTTSKQENSLFPAHKTLSSKLVLFYFEFQWNLGRLKRSVWNIWFTAKCETAILESVCLFFDYKFPFNPWKCFLKEFSLKMVPLHMKFNFMNHHPPAWQKSRYSKTALVN